MLTKIDISCTIFYFLVFASEGSKTTNSYIESHWMNSWFSSSISVNEYVLKLLKLDFRTTKEVKKKIRSKT